MVAKYSLKISWETGSLKAVYPKPSLMGVRKYNKVFLSIEIDTKTPARSLKAVLDTVLADRSVSPQKKEAFKRLVEWDLEFVYHCNMAKVKRQPTSEETLKLEALSKSDNKHESAKATAILMAATGNYYIFEIVRATGSSRTSIQRWLRNFTYRGLVFIDAPYDTQSVLEARERKRKGILEIIHSPPAAYGINRTSWTFETIGKAYAATKRERVSRETIRRIIKESGYTWQRARQVLTSGDPEYREKVNKVLEVIQGLKEGELFFFVDEAGPWRVKKYGGIALTPKGQPIELPEHQHPRGIVKFIAALEATTNQLTWFFTNRRTAGTMIELFETLKAKYPDCPKFYVTWDSLSSHRAKTVANWVQATNGSGVGADIEIVPLPSRAQFLNVIEAVFSTTRRAVIHNSDYPCKEAMEYAIDRHFEERNEFYRENPKRAGSKIWDKTAFQVDELPCGLFRKM